MKKYRYFVMYSIKCIFRICPDSLYRSIEFRHIDNDYLNYGVADKWVPSHCWDMQSIIREGKELSEAETFMELL